MTRVQWIWRGDPCLRMVIFLATVASLVSFAYFYSQGMITAFGDAQSRLMIARSVVDGVHTGLAQLGAIWLPLPHVAMLPFVWNDFLYSSGIAGAVISMASYVLTSVFLYKLVVDATKDRLAGLIGVIAFSGPNTLYMQSVPMSEMPFIAFFVISVYFLSKWAADVKQWGWLIPASIATACAAATRYEGFVLAGVELSIIAIVCWRSRFDFAKVSAFLMYFSFWVVAWGTFWFVWNWAIFGDLLYFVQSQYSPWAIAQETLTVMDPRYKTVGNFPLSFMVYGKTILDNAGWISTILAALGLALLLVTKQPSARKIAALVLLFPFPFFVLTIFQGGSVIILHPDFAGGANWGTRYGTLMLPAVGFFVGFLIHQKRWLKVVGLVLVLLSVVLIWQGGIISVNEEMTTKTSSTSQIQQAAGNWFKENWDGGFVLRQRFGNELTAFASGIPFSKTIYEGDRELWAESLKDPTKHVRWVFMRKDIYGREDRVWEALQGTRQLAENYDLVYQDGGMEIYRRKDQ